MKELLLLFAGVLLLAIASSKLLYRFGVPTLLIFLGLGMFFGCDGPGGIQFSDYQLTGNVCSVGLIFIMFYGGFGTSWKEAQPVAKPAILMSSLGTLLTALLTGGFAAWVLDVDWLQGMLVGAVLGSTDAASVFSILRSRRLDLKDGLASLLEIESGSNDPFAYMLTIIFLTLSTTGAGAEIVMQVLRQLIFGLGIGWVVGKGAIAILSRIRLEIDGLYSLFVMACALLSYALCEYVGGNGYLCVYLAGILLGNAHLPHKRSMVHFFDGITWLMQIMLFFMLGLLSYPSRFPRVALPAVFIALFMIFVARPLTVEVLLGHLSRNAKMFVSWVGLRGAASIVFAIFAVTGGSEFTVDLFHIVFVVSLVSVGLQGSLTPMLAKKLDLIEQGHSVLRTFNDYQDESLTQLMEYHVEPDSQWAGQSLMEADIPHEVLVVMIRRGNETIVPRGDTVIQPGDVLVLSCADFDQVALV